jgi:hypothetical protein
VDVVKVGKVSFVCKTSAHLALHCFDVQELAKNLLLCRVDWLVVIPDVVLSKHVKVKFFIIITTESALRIVVLLWVYEHVLLEVLLPLHFYRTCLVQHLNEVLVVEMALHFDVILGFKFADGARKGFGWFFEVVKQGVVSSFDALIVILLACQNLLLLLLLIFGFFWHFFQLTSL